MVIPPYEFVSDSNIMVVHGSIGYYPLCVMRSLAWVSISFDNVIFKFINTKMR